jgi:hypothetical protein
MSATKQNFAVVAAPVGAAGDVPAAIAAGIRRDRLAPHDADARVSRLRDVQVASGGEGDATRLQDSGRERRPAIAVAVVHVHGAPAARAVRHPPKAEHDRCCSPVQGQMGYLLMRAPRGAALNEAVPMD